MAMNQQAAAPPTDMQRPVKLTSFEWVTSSGMTCPIKRERTFPSLKQQFSNMWVEIVFLSEPNRLKWKERVSGQFRAHKVFTACCPVEMAVSPPGSWHQFDGMRDVQDLLSMYQALALISYTKKKQSDSFGWQELLLPWFCRYCPKCKKSVSLYWLFLCFWKCIYNWFTDFTLSY